MPFDEHHETDSETSAGGSESYESYAPAAFVGENFDKQAVFPRVKERDPYRRLGIDAEASYEEVQDAQLPGGHLSRAQRGCGVHRGGFRSDHPG